VGMEVFYHTGAQRVRIELSADTRR